MDLELSYQLTMLLIHEVLTATSNEQIGGGIFCDLTTAFDCVNHRILSSKLQQYGTVGKLQYLIKFYLIERYTRVIIHNNSSYSDWELVKHGIPQGSVFGPSFFLLYINYMPITTSNNAKLVLHIDDTSSISYKFSVHI
jgi:hypothetical protein